MSQDPSQTKTENIFEETTSDLSEELFMTIVHIEDQLTENL